jgi:hypothetical protein
MLQKQGKSIGQTEGHESVLKWNTISRNTNNIVLGAEFDLTIAQTQIKDRKITYPKSRYHLAST